MTLKKIKRKLFIFILMLISIGRVCMPVLAQTGNVSLDTHGNRWRIGLSTIFYDRFLQTQRNITSIRIDNFTINGENVFCVEPNVEIYPSISMEILNGQEATNALYNAGYTDAEINEMALISSLGYGYAGDMSEAMNAATQVRIWQVHFGNVISNIPADIQAKIDIINDRIRKMNTPLSFENQTFELKGYGEKYAITIEDTNGVFSDYVLNTNPTGAHIEKDGNSMRLWIEEGGDEAGNIVFDGLYNSSEATNNRVAYYNPQNQTLASFGKVSPRQASFNYQVKPSEGQIFVNKIGEILESATIKKEGKITKTSFVYKDTVLSNTTFDVIANEDIYNGAGELIYHKNDIVDTITTDENGIANTKQLPYGRYVLKETATKPGYIINKDPINIELQVNENGENIIQEQVHNDRIRLNLDLIKISSSTKKPLKNALYCLYLKEDLWGANEVILPKGTLIESVYSDDEGKLKFESDLPFCTYELKEIEPCPGYELNDETIVIDMGSYEENTIFKKVLENDFQKVSICINKVDNDDQPIKNGSFEFGLYKDKECKELIEKVQNDKNSEFIIFDDLDVGIYYIKESKAPEGYELSNEVVCVEVQEYGKVFFNGNEAKSDENKIYSIKYKNKKLPEIHTGIKIDKSFYIGLSLVMLAAVIFIRIFMNKKA